MGYPEGDTSMALTATAAKNAKAQAKPYKLHDSGGLYLLVKPNGGKYWRMNYRFDGKNKTLALGTFARVSLAQAREKRDKAKEQLAEGQDPSEQRRIEKLTAGVSSGTTFREIAEEWFSKLEREGRAEATMRKKRWFLETAYPKIGDRPISELTVPELLAVLYDVEGRGLFESAQRLRSTFSQVFRYAVATGRASRDITAELKGALTVPKVKHRAAILDAKTFGELLRAIDGFDGQRTTKTALQLAPHVFVRPGELRHAEWDEFDFDRAIWTIPAPKTKMGQEHKVPLSRQVLALLKDLHTVSGRGRYLK